MTNNPQPFPGWAKIVAAVVVLFLAWRLFLDKAPEKEKGEKTPMSVRAVPVERGAIRQHVFGEGTARAVRRDFLVFESSGKVDFIAKGPDGKEIREGSAVQGPKKGERLGQLLARIDSRQEAETVKLQEANLGRDQQAVKVAKAGLAEAESQLRYAKSSYDRNKKLLEQGLKSKADFEQVKNEYLKAEASIHSAEAQVQQALADVKVTEAELSKARIDLEHKGLYAPFNGMVAFLNIRVGDYFTAGSVDRSNEQAQVESCPIVVVDTSEYEIKLELPSFYGESIKPGQKAVIVHAGQSGDLEEAEEKDKSRTAHGTVFGVSPAITPGGRSVVVKIRTTAGAEHLADGLFVNARIVTEEKDDVLLLPLDSVMFRENKPFVFVLDPVTNKIERRQFEVGIGDKGRLEVTKGLQEGELVVTDGKLRLVEGATVRRLPPEGHDKGDAGGS